MFRDAQRPVGHSVPLRPRAIILRPCCVFSVFLFGYCHEPGRVRGIEHAEDFGDADVRQADPPVAHATTRFRRTGFSGPSSVIPDKTTGPRSGN